MEKFRELKQFRQLVDSRHARFTNCYRVSIGMKKKAKTLDNLNNVETKVRVLNGHTFS